MKTYALFIIVIILCNVVQAQNQDEVVRFLKENPKKSSIYLIEDGKNLIDFNGRQQMPLASAVKTIIAIEFAKQCAAKKNLAFTKVSVKDLDKYYIQNTDGGVHPKWLESIGKTLADSVSVLEIAQGMIRYSSNANTEYLMDLLGLANVNKNISELDMKIHQPLYYFTAAALMVCLKPADIDENAWIKQLSALSIGDYRRKCEEAHKRLKTEPSFIKLFNFSGLSLNIQKIWSDRLIASTTADYAKLMQKIASRTYFPPDVQLIIESIMEWPMHYQVNKTQFNHAGGKGGSTAFVFTDTFYAVYKDGKQLACSIFFNDLTGGENVLLAKNIGAFKRFVLTNADFRQKLVEELAE